MHSATGRITQVQEERFRLIEPDGRGFLFTLAHNANVSAEDLHSLLRRGTEVRVHYEGEPDLDSAVARTVKTIL
jgi:hypothetical protein